MADDVSCRCTLARGMRHAQRVRSNLQHLDVHAQGRARARSTFNEVWIFYFFFFPYKSRRDR
jgi:hypothetical protein